MSRRPWLGNNVYIGLRTPIEITNPIFELYYRHKHPAAVLTSMYPKSIIDLKSMKYLPVATLAAKQTELVKRSKQKRDAESEYVKVYPPASSRQKPIIPNWTTVQYNRRPIINTPWMKDTQGVALTQMNNINNAMLELSDFDIQRETAKANLVLVQKMGELVQAEKDKVKSEMSRIQVDIQKLMAEKERYNMDTQKLEMEKEMYEAKLMSGVARSS